MCFPLDTSCTLRRAVLCRICARHRGNPRPPARLLFDRIDAPRGCPPVPGPLAPDDSQDAAARLLEVIRAAERQPAGPAAQSAVWSAMSPHPAYLAANWERERAIMQRGLLQPLERQ